MRKKLLSLALALCMVLAILPTAAFAASSEFEIENGVLSKYNGPGGDVVIPDGVTEIEFSAFWDSTNVTSVIIPSSVTKINEEYAFDFCDDLTAIQVDEGNQNYASIDGVLFNKSKTELLQYPKGKEGSYNIPNGVTKIGRQAFYDCDALTSLTIPSSVTEMGDQAIHVCTNLTTIQVDEGNQTYASVDGALLNKAKTELLQCPWGKKGHYSIPDGVTKIEMGAIDICQSLTSVTIPSSVAEIGYGTFDSCPSITAIQVDPGNQHYTSIDGVVFDKAKTMLVAYPGGKQGAYTIPNSVTVIGKNAFTGSRGLTSVTIPDSVTEIEESAFSDCVYLTSITIPNSVKKIGGSAFLYCFDMTSITIPDSVTEIGHSAFLECSSLTSITIPSSVTEIEMGMFKRCYNLTSIAIPASVTEIGDMAFEECTALKDVYYEGSEEQWKKIKINNNSDGNACLLSATIHYNTTMPTTPDQPAKDVAHASAQTVTVDGKPVEFQMYALKDASGNDTNYIKLRDMACVLNGTKAQFNVGYDQQSGTITAATGIAYKEDGTEMTATFGGADKEYVKTTLTIQLDGKPVQLEAITLTDSTGGGYNYCKVRDLGQTFNFNVDWNTDVGIYIESDKPYSG